MQGDDRGQAAGERTENRLVEAAGGLPGAEGKARDAETRVDAEAAAAGKAGGSCAVARWGSGPG